mgnify:CR=1 FL=1
MSLIKSISGIRGTIGGKAGDGLNPLDIVKFTAAYATFIRKNTPVKTNKIVVGRDARISGEMVKHTVIGTRMGSDPDHRDCRDYGESLRWNYIDSKSQSQTMECFEIAE